MGFFDKLKSAVRKIKGKLIAYGVLVLIIILWLVMPFCVAVIDANETAGVMLLQDMTNGDWWSTFIMGMSSGITAPWKMIPLCFTEKYIMMFLQTLKWVIILSFLISLIGIAKAIPKHEYQDIENGSSDWSEGGEQYKILSKKTGIVLAEKNYLPVDKRGNVNVLVVRRFWCW